MEIYEEYKEYAENEDVIPQIFSDEVMQEIFLEVANKDAAFAVFSVLFVFLYLIFHLRSIFLAAMGILIIVCSFPVASIISKGIF